MFAPLSNAVTNETRARSRSPSRSPGPRGRSLSPRSRSITGSPSRSPIRKRRDHSPSRGRSYSRSPSYSSRSRSPFPRRSGGPPPPASSSKIIIERLTKNITQQHIQEIFSTYGKIESIDMPMQRYFPVNRGVAYVIYDKPSEADSAIEHMHEGQIDGTVVNVSIVLARQPPRGRARCVSGIRSPNGGCFGLYAI